MIICLFLASQQLNQHNNKSYTNLQFYLNLHFKMVFKFSAITTCLSLCLCLGSLKVTMGFVPVSEFFPFGREHGDQPSIRQDDVFVGPISLTVGYPFFNDTYTRVYVSNNGAISFRKGINQYTPTCGALDRQSTMIAPYWTDVDIRNGGDIWYRESTNSTVLAKASQEIRNAFPDSNGVSVSWIFIATWSNVSFFGSRDGDCRQPEDSRNTFQAILGTDGSRSFAIFYYDDLKWTTGRASGGNCSGLGGTPAKAGFDVGDGSTFFVLPGSCRQQILNIAETTNVNQAGKWIFRVDSNLEASSCDNDLERLEFTQLYYSWSLQWGSQTQADVGYVNIRSRIDCASFSIEASNGGVEPYLSIGDDGAITNHRTNQDLVNHQGEVDIFIVTVVRTRNETQESVQVTIIIYNEPDASLLPRPTTTTTQAPSTCAPCPTVEVPVCPVPTPCPELPTPPPCECPTCPTEATTQSTTTTTEATTTTTTVAPTTTTTTTTTTEQPTTPVEFTCRQEGYFADPASCAGFFRCVRLWPNSNVLTKYPYTCPGDTIWCQSNYACSFRHQCRERCDH